jgi:prepilin-type N-terminal cleavage/methylation domain-containing protein
MRRPTMRGFALVEVLVGLVIVAILAGVVIVVVNSVGYDASAEACRQEASAFKRAVDQYYARHEPHVWPSGGSSNSVLTTAYAMKITGDLETEVATALAHLDGSQRGVADSTPGWTYDFDRHTTDTAGCS